jgi:hypothetical protein
MMTARMLPLYTPTSKMMRVPLLCEQRRKFADTIRAWERRFIPQKDQR